MDMSEYQRKTNLTQIYSIAARDFINAPTAQQLQWLELAYCTGKLNGEAGEAAEIVFKAFRGNQGVLTQEHREALIKELGDIMWYVSEMASLIGISLERVAGLNIQKLIDRQSRDVLHGYGDNR